jgi:anti-sigma regulatory factor (Ser/Thr protein kinase)
MPRPCSGSESRPDGRFVLSIPSVVEALPGARHQFSRWLEGTSVARHVWDELAVAFSELTANAVDASEDTSLDVGAQAWCEGSDLVLEVVNAAAGSGQPMRRWDLDDQLRSGGRGLGIVQALVDSVAVDRDAHGRLVVRCRRSISDTI